MKVCKYTALGNDYLFINAQNIDSISENFVRKICDRHFGIGADGVLFGEYNNNKYLVKIYNSDGSIAEMSGNGTMIFARAMFDNNQTIIGDVFTIDTHFKKIECKIFSQNEIEINVEIANFSDINIPTTNNNKTISINGKIFQFYPVSIGNPHCVVFVEELNKNEILTYGPIFENLQCFIQKTNVQFAKKINNNLINIEIWERGSGYTLASGSSSCAVFAVARKLNLCDNNTTISMPGGSVSVHENLHNEIIMCGTVSKIAECSLAKEFIANIS